MAEDALETAKRLIGPTAEILKLEIDLTGRSTPTAVLVAFVERMPFQVDEYARIEQLRQRGAEVPAWCTHRYLLLFDASYRRNHDADAEIGANSLNSAVDIWCGLTGTVLAGGTLSKEQARLLWDLCHRYGHIGPVAILAFWAAATSPVVDPLTMGTASGSFPWAFRDPTGLRAGLSRIADFEQARKGLQFLALAMPRRSQPAITPGNWKLRLEEFSNKL